MDSPPVAIVSDELVHEHFPDGSPLGRRLRINIDHANGRDDVEWTIVGVVEQHQIVFGRTRPSDHLLPTTQRPAFVA